MTQRNAHVLIISRILFPLAFKQHASPKILIHSHKHAALPALMLLTTKKARLIIIQLKNKLHRNVVCSVTALPIALSLFGNSIKRFHQKLSYSKSHHFLTQGLTSLTRAPRALSRPSRALRVISSLTAPLA